MALYETIINSRGINMSIFNLDRMFKPKSVAVIGASKKEGRIGTSIMRNLIDGGYNGLLYPVNLHYRKIFDHRVYNSVRKLPAQPDLVVIATPIQTVPGLITACKEMNAGGVVVVSAGGKEIGQKGVEIEAKLSDTIKNSDIRMIGPNCLGIISSKSKLNASFSSYMPYEGKMAFISQSGAICTAILDFAMKERIGFSHFISLGSMLDVDFGDMIDYLGNDPEVGSIVMYVENLSRIRNFMSAARAVSRIKPIIVLKAGRSSAGAEAAASHTGVMAGEDAVYDAAFKRAGIIRVKTFAELFDCTEFLGKQPMPAGPRLAIVTNAGGPGVMAADALSDYGVEPAALSPKIISRLNKILPPHWSHGNPVDILGDASSEQYALAVDILINAQEVDGLLVMIVPQAATNPARVAEALAMQLHGNPIPVFTTLMGGVDMEPARDIFNAAGITTFDSPERAIRAFMDLYQYSKNIEMLQEIPASLPRKFDFDRNTVTQLIQKGLKRSNELLTEVEAKELLFAYGIPVNRGQVATDASLAVEIADHMGYPVVIKVNSLEITHKTDAEGVVLDVRDADAVRKAYEDIHSRVTAMYPVSAFDGVSIQPMLKRPDYELIMGAKKDRDFGPVILFGLGGILTEIHMDRSIAFPPLNRILARRLMEETRIYRVLSGYRNHRAVDMAQLEEMLIRLSHLVTDFSEIELIDINPIIITDTGIMAVDARVIVRDTTLRAPLHLVISPYPNQYEDAISVEGVGKILIRPIRPEDAPLLVELFDSLSPLSVYYRFFTHMRELPPGMLARFTQIDYDREVAMVAIMKTNDVEKLLGVGRIIPEFNRKSAEFAIMVMDRFHGKGIAAALLKRCLTIAEMQNIEKIWGLVLPENTKMLALGKKIGFTVKHYPKTGKCELMLNLRNHRL